MQIIKMMLITLILSCFMIPCSALPPFQVLRSCMDLKPYDNKSKTLRLDGGGYADKSIEGCEEQYDREINDHMYGTLMCNQKFYFIINDKKIDPELADNQSINPEIKPGVEFTTRSLWYKIDYEDKEYICIYAPLAEQGVGASRVQYYLIENAFDKKLTPQLTYYFFDKNIAPITSKTL